MQIRYYQQKKKRLFTFFQSPFSTLFFSFAMFFFLFYSIPDAMTQLKTEGLSLELLNDEDYVTKKEDVDSSSFYYLNVVRQHIKDDLAQKHSFPSSISVEDKHETLTLTYSFDEELTAQIKKIIGRYRPDYASVVVLENRTGKVLSLYDFSRKKGEITPQLALGPHHPAASLIKVVTSAALLEQSGFSTDENFTYRGRSTTLYRYQLKPDSKRGRARTSTFKRAFAKSNNVVFARAAEQLLGPGDLYEMAKKFGFNEGINYEFPLYPSVFQRSTDTYHAAELASGFNKETLISPLHAALMVSVAANKGKLVYPRFIDKVNLSVAGEDLILPGQTDKQVVSSEVAKELRELMKRTIVEGTARKSFRRFSRKLKGKLEMGGKTGSLTGGVPFGKRDWFIMYALPKDENNVEEVGHGVSIAVMLVNKKRWYVKAAYLARKITEYYFRRELKQ